MGEKSKIDMESVERYYNFGDGGRAVSDIQGRIEQIGSQAWQCKSPKHPLRMF